MMITSIQKLEEHRRKNKDTFYEVQDLDKNLNEESKKVKKSDPKKS